MQITELIEVCQAALKHHGDLPVFVYNNKDKSLSLISVDNFYVQSDEDGRIVVLTEDEKNEK